MIKIVFLQRFIGCRLDIAGDNKVKGIFLITDFVNRFAGRQTHQLHRIHNGNQLGMG